LDEISPTGRLRTPVPREFHGRLCDDDPGACYGESQGRDNTALD
jgi:hypothetical protein